jgi:fructose-1-phosphate kinase PfkB-like protein
MAAAHPRPVPVFGDTFGPALAAVLIEGPAVVKLNADEAGQSSAMAVSDASSAAEAGAVLRELGATWAVVTLRSAGAVVVGPGDQVHLLPPDVRGAYPVGSGDAFLGGLAVAYARGEPVVEAARLGLAAGIANAQIPGAGELDPTAVDGILGRITQVSM